MEREKEREFTSALKKNVEVSKDRQWSRNACETDGILLVDQGLSL